MSSKVITLEPRDRLTYYQWCKETGSDPDDLNLLQAFMAGQKSVAYGFARLLGCNVTDIQTTNLLRALVNNEV